MKTGRIGAKQIFLIVLCAVIIGDAVVHKHTSIVLQGFFCNDESDFFPADELEKAYASQLGLGKWEQIHFEDDLFVEVGSTKDYTTASASKIVAYTSAKELDFLVVPEHLLGHYGSAFALMDLRQWDFPSLEKWFITGRDGTGDEKAYAVNMAQSRYLAGKNPSEPYYLMVPENSRRKTAVREYLAYLFMTEGNRSPRDQ